MNVAKTRKNLALDVEDCLAQRLRSAGQSFLAAFQIQENKPRFFLHPTTRGRGMHFYSNEKNE
ncbi:hypothetical protein [Mesonia maritima]|uniref:Uncharacterized protein n=1 Tax=Mesonia maritima TaxID=1793873 RepID=A0ABU1K853_9FLAO|nr:hypothetical protein [Mesonia maritima]MDR6301805.1 hypothetical protein [Mesonia maritima]